MFLDDIALKPKLLAGFVIMILIAILLSYIGFSSMGSMTQKADQMYDERLMALDDLLNADNSFLNIRINIYKTVWAADERSDKFAEIDDEIKNIRSRVDTYAVNASDSVEKEQIQEFNTQWTAFEKKLREIIADMEAGREDAAVEGLTSDAFSVPRDRAQDALDNLEEFNYDQARRLKEEIASLYQTSVLLSLLTTAFAVIFGLSFALIITNSITRPLAGAAEMISDMEKGHLRKRLGLLRQDEVGQMARSMDLFADGLQYRIIEPLQKVAIGENVQLPDIRDTDDEITPVIRTLILTIQGLTDETENLIDAAKGGELSIRGDASRFRGKFAGLISGINEILDSFLVPVREAMTLSDAYASGDFSSRFSEKIEIKGDFIRFKGALDTIGVRTGEAIADVKEEVSNLMAGMEETNGSVEEVSASSQNLAQNASRVSDLSEKSSLGIQQILHAMNDLASAVSAVASESNQVASLTQAADDLSTTGTTLVAETKEGMDKIKHSFEETNTDITEISQQMIEIGSIVGVIGAIADQTNLLALNAAIEAARAGEAGRGFAVVAEEVKALAEESRLSAEKIGDLIAGLQKKSQNVTRSMEHSIADVNAGDQAVKETLEVFGKIAESIAEVSLRISDVAATTQEQAASVEEISASVHEVGTLVEQASRESEDASTATEEASAALNQISHAVGDATGSVQVISTAMEKFRV